ncbi:transcriptional activator acu-15 [Fusarium heterosporum]|uniref:Transcriptional activator acu-15 n=1 Tax=Fusarium heterosporum TaxID=42747 RepID=A0A8H5TN72_FUSHE|nr:transcriptional activator acu-15 [Fusarium heterosporum]
MLFIFAGGKAELVNLSPPATASWRLRGISSKTSRGLPRKGPGLDLDTEADPPCSASQLCPAIQCMAPAPSPHIIIVIIIIITYIPLSFCIFAHKSQPPFVPPSHPIPSSLIPSSPGFVQGLHTAEPSGPAQSQCIDPRSPLMHSAFPTKPVPCTVPVPTAPTTASITMMEAISQRNFNSSIANFSTPTSLSSTPQQGPFYWPFDSRSYSALSWTPETFAYNCHPALAAVRATATSAKPTGRRPRQPAAISRCTARTKANTAPPSSASSNSACSSAASSARSSPALSRGAISPRPKSRMPGRPPKRAASHGEDEGHIQAPGKVKLPRLERGPDDFSSVVKNRLQSYTRTGQACDRCKVRKIRCDALPEGCSHCTNQNLECYVTDRVTGRTERRGYLQELEREKSDMLSHIRDLEKLLDKKGVEVKPWEWSPYAQYPPDVNFDDMGNPIPGQKSDNWSQVGSAWFKNSSSNPSPVSSFPKTLESRPQENHLGVGLDSAPMSSIGGTRLSILGMTVDFSSFEAPDMDEPPVNESTPAPSYNKSPQALLQSIMRVNPPRHVDMPSREDAFTYAEWYFMTFSAFLPVLHKPTFMRLLTRMYDEPNFEPSVADRVIVHMVFAIICYQYGTRNWQQVDQRIQMDEQSNNHYHFALSKFFELSCIRDLASVQAMALIVKHTRAFPKPGCVAIIANLALQRALELNLHRESRKPGEGTNLQHELRKRAFWVIMTVYIAVVGRRGRPMPITVEELDVGFPEPIADELLSDEGVDTSRDIPCPYWPGIVSFKIIPIYMEMYSNIYSVRRDARNYVSVVKALEAQIKNWEDELPGHLTLGHAEQTEQTRLAALYSQTWALEFRLCLRHPSVAMTSDKKMMAENMSICENVSRKMLQYQLEIQKCRCLDTTWYQTSMYTAGCFTMLAAMWERRFETTPEAIATLREEMNGWVGILEEASSLLGSESSFGAEIGNIVNRTIAWIDHDMRNKESKSAQPSITPEIKQEQPPQASGYQPSQVQPPVTNGVQDEAPTPKGYFPESGIDGQSAYPTLAYNEHAQNNMAPAYDTGAMFYNTSAQAAAVAASTSALPSSVAQVNPMLAFSQPPQTDMLWQGRGNTWHDWTSAIADTQDRFSASTLLTLGGNTRDASNGAGVPGVTASPSANDINSLQQPGQWPLIIFDQVAPNGS